MDVQLDKHHFIGCTEVSVMDGQKNFSDALCVKMKQELMRGTNSYLLEKGIISKELYEACEILIGKIKED